MDTALEACSVAITASDQVLASHFEVRHRGHAETLLPLIKSLMSDADMSFDDLDMLAVSVGPGTFTGLRIGLSVARGISLAAGKPCLGVTTLEALAASIPVSVAANKDILVAADARRKEVYYQIFRYTGGADFPAPVSEAQAAPVTDINARLDGSRSYIGIGSGCPLLQAAGQFDNVDILIPDTEQNPDARLIAKIAAARGLPEHEAPPPAPVYLRAPDAKLPGGIDPATVKGPA